MDCIEDIRSLLQGIVHAQSIGSYTLENSEQIAPVVRRIINKYPQLLQPPQPQKSQQVQPLQSQQQQQVQPLQSQQQRQVQPQSQQQQQIQPQQKLTNLQSDTLIQKIMAEPNNVTINDSRIETFPVQKQNLNQNVKMENGIETISLPVQ